MLTKQFEELSTLARINPLFEGVRPIFTKQKYDSHGRELKVKVEGQEEDNRSFLAKYWWMILMAFFMLPNLIGGGGAAAS